MESHDEQRLMYEALTSGLNNGSGYDVRNLPTALARMDMNAAFFLPIPGPKMMWQFGELGYDIDINQNGRTGAKPILWNYLQDAQPPPPARYLRQPDCPAQAAGLQHRPRSPTSSAASPSRCTSPDPTLNDDGGGQLRHLLRPD